MSLLDDVSIVVTPNGYKAGELYAVIPVPTEGAEEVTNGDFSADNSWTKQTGWTISGGSANCDGTQTGNSGIIQQNGIAGVSLDLQVGKQYKMVIDITVSAGLITYIEVGGNNYNDDITNTGIKTLYFSPTSTNDRISIVAGSTFVGSVNNVSVKEYTSADMDVTRATAATRVDENGLVNYAEIIGDSILTGNNSNFDTGIGSWVSYNGGTLAHSTDKLEVTLTTGESGAGINTNSLISGGQAGKIFKVRAKIWQGTSTNSTILIFMGGSQKAITISSTPTYFEIELTPSNTGSLYIYRSGGSGGVGTYFIDDVTVKEVTRDNVPRIDYTGGGCPHILAEPQRTNNLTASQDLTNSFWNVTRVETVAASTVLSPDGTTFGFKAIPNSENNTHYLWYDYGFLSMPEGVEVTYSVFVKPFGYTNFQLATSTNFALKYQNFELTGDGVVGTGDVNGAKIEKIGEWYRCSVTETTIGTTPRVLSIATPSSGLGRNPTFTGNGTDGVLLWGAQLEEGTYATSYIPNLSTTSGSTVTRNQDIFTRDGIGSLINSTEGVLFAEIAALSNDESYRYMGLTDGTDDNRVIILYYSSNNRIRVLLSSGGTKYFDAYYEVTSIKDFHKIAVKWKENDFALFIDGGEKATDTSGLTPIGLNTLALDQAGSNNFFGKVKQLQVYKTALTDTQLAALTS